MVKVNQVIKESDVVEFESKFKMFQSHRLIRSGNLGKKSRASETEQAI